MKLEESGLMMRKLFLDIDGEEEGVGPAWWWWGESDGYSANF